MFEDEYVSLSNTNTIRNWPVSNLIISCQHILITENDFLISLIIRVPYFMNIILWIFSRLLTSMSRD